jgi:hypothetical protein
MRKAALVKPVANCGLAETELLGYLSYGEEFVFGAGHRANVVGLRRQRERFRAACHLGAVYVGFQSGSWCSWSPPLLTSALISLDITEAGRPVAVLISAAVEPGIR